MMMMMMISVIRPVSSVLTLFCLFAIGPTGSLCSGYKVIVQSRGYRRVTSVSRR